MKKHYSEVLKDKIEEHNCTMQEVQDRVILFKAHLNSSKFHEDTTIQVSDVHRWLDMIMEPTN